MDNIDFAQNNEVFSDTILEDHPDQKNWVVTIRFYSYIHYVEEKLKMHGYSSTSHDNRKDNIRNCAQVDNRARSIYRKLEDISRDARYECIKMTDDDVEESESKLEEGKNVLGFVNGGDSTKYTI